MRHGKFLGAAISVCCLVMISGRPAFADLLDDIMQAKAIRISTDLAIPPSGMMDGSMKPTGSDVEVAELLASDWGLKLEFVQTTGATRIPNVLTAQRMTKVILPQAVRIATPPTVGFMVQIIKNTSLASVVGFVELMRAGQIVNNSLFEPFAIYAIIAVVYFAMCYPLSLVSQRLERRMGRSRANLAPA